MTSVGVRDTIQPSAQIQHDSRTEDGSEHKVRKVRSTALSKAVSSIPTCGYVDRRDKIDHHVKECKDIVKRGGETHRLILSRQQLVTVVSYR